MDANAFERPILGGGDGAGSFLGYEECIATDRSADGDAPRDGAACLQQVLIVDRNVHLDRRVPDEMALRRQVEFMLDARQLVDGWTTSADVENTKPEPDLVNAALEKAGGDGHSVMVGDSVWDVKAAKAAGLPTLAVLTGGFSEAELREAGASQVVETIGELDFESLFAESAKT